MDVRLLETGDVPEAKALWKEAFVDSDAFIDWYFKNKVLRGHSLGAFDEGGLVSVLHMIPFVIRLQGKPVSSLMIAGAATKAERRGEGHMRALLLRALEEMRRRGVFITHLYPFKHSFYERFGWTTVTRVHRSTVTQAPLRRDIEVFETDDYRVLDHIYKRMMRAYDGCVLRGSREWRWRLGELKADGGHAAVLIRGDAAAAYALFYGSHKKADVIETVYTGEEDIGALLSYILRQGFGRVNYFLPAQTQGTKYGMARVVDAEALLRFFDAEALLKDVVVTDDFAFWNNTRPADYEMSVSTLAKAVCTGISGVKGDLKSLLKRRELFADRPTCIFEMF
jgi:predicted N-acetyltransferase YhbS